MSDVQCVFDGLAVNPGIVIRRFDNVQVGLHDAGFHLVGRTFDITVNRDGVLVVIQIGIIVIGAVIDQRVEFNDHIFGIGIIAVVVGQIAEADGEGVGRGVKNCAA